MPYFCKERNNPLHQAVIENDLPSAANFSTRKGYALEANGLGFTPLEIAHYLNRREIIKLLDPSPSPPLAVQLPDSTELIPFDREELFSAFHFRYTDSLHFASYSDFKLALSRGRGALYSFFAGKESRQLGRDYQGRFTKSPIEGLSLRWIDNTLGYGVYAEKEIPEMSFVGEYTGLFRALSKINPPLNAYCFHYPIGILTAKLYLIDALHEGNILRFVNHSDIPNLLQQQMIERGLLHIAFTATRKIKKGEQLTVNYGRDYWQRRIKKEVA